MIRLINFFKFTLISSAILSILALILFFYFLWKFSPQLPSYDKILDYKPNLSSRVYSSDGLLLKSFFLEERIYVPQDRIPLKIKNAFIAAEDKNFFSHIGIDFKAILRASITNIYNYSSNKRVVGASTITQQVVKNLLLTNELTYERKIKEILLSIRVERVLSKNKILELYLNDIYLGFGSYGIASASLNYFNKSIDDLDLHEIAYLAALPKAPNNYHPIKKYEEAIERRNWVLDKMYQNGFIKKNELIYKEKPLKIFKRNKNLFTNAEYYYEEIRKNLYKKYGKDKLYSEGLIVKTSIDTKIQSYVNESLKQGLILYDKSQGWRGPVENVIKEIFLNNKILYDNINPYPNNWFPLRILEWPNKNLLIGENLQNEIFSIQINTEANNWLSKAKFKEGDIIFVENLNQKLIIRQIPNADGAIVVINPHNGDVLALSGGFSFKLSEFNRATQAKRQPGSAFKPFVYITALNEGYTPSTLILDAPYVVDQGPGLPKWKPANYTEEFYGLTTMRTGIEKSRNLMTVRLAHQIGMKKIINNLKGFGISNDINEQLSMSLGSGLVTLIDLTNAYAIIANGG